MNKITSAVKFVKRNERRILYTVAIAGVASTALMRVGLKQHNEFLKEKNLYEEFYQPENSY